MLPQSFSKKSYAHSALMLSTFEHGKTHRKYGKAMTIPKGMKRCRQKNTVLYGIDTLLPMIDIRRFEVLLAVVWLPLYFVSVAVKFLYEAKKMMPRNDVTCVHSDETGEPIVLSSHSTHLISFSNTSSKYSRLPLISMTRRKLCYRTGVRSTSGNDTRARIFGNQFDCQEGWRLVCAGR